MGQRYVALTEGSGQGGALPANGVIPKEQTQPALDLTALFNGFRPLLRAIKPQEVNQLTYEIIQVLQGEGGTINGLLAPHRLADPDPRRPRRGHRPCHRQPRQGHRDH